MTAATMPTPREMAVRSLDVRERTIEPTRCDYCGPTYGVDPDPHCLVHCGHQTHARRWREAQSPPPDRPWVFKGRSGEWIISGSQYWGGEREMVFPSFAEAIAHAHAEAVRHG